VAMIEVFPGIRWLKLPIEMEQSDLKYVNVYLVEEGNGFLLVDTGWNTDEAFSALHNALIKSGHSFQSIKQILVTHVHPDHYGMAGRIKELSGATITMHHIEKEFIEPRYVNMEPLLHQTDLMMVNNGVPEHEMVELRDASLDVINYIVPTQPDKVLHDGDFINAGKFRFKVIWTPGHSSGHVCLFEAEKKLLLSGDHILPRITPNVSMNPQSIENPLGRYLRSLEEIKGLDIELTLPGHDEPFNNLNMRINEIIHHHNQRNTEILETILAEPRTAYRIAKDIKWGNNGGTWKDLPPFHKRMAVFETMAHLEMMAADSRIDKMPRKGIVHYRQKPVAVK
jgi:glyoxylase-like metal-dependent hydrolase (beta-lactamase superfamily II)